jgi:hypothetical protein
MLEEAEEDPIIQELHLMVHLVVQVVVEMVDHLQQEQEQMERLI